jgi:hypothetical protein
MFTFVLLSSFTICNYLGNQEAFYECTEPLKIKKTLFEYKEGKTYFSFNKNLEPTKLKSKGFIWLEDMPKEYFTGYLINASDSIFNAEKQDGSLIMIQEAIDKNGDWQPIEYWTYSGCGNSYFHPLTLKPGKYIMIPIKKYNGNYKTKIRLKLKKDKSIFYSDPFDGSIETSQFDKKTDNVDGILYHGPANYLDEK